MTWLLLVMISALLDFSAVFVNARLLIISIKDKAKYNFLQNGRVLVICRYACQVTLLLMDAMYWWNGFPAQPKEPCDFLKVVFVSILFFYPFNLTVMIIVLSAPEDPATQTNQEIFVNLRVSAALTLGFFGPAVLFWRSCFYEGYRSLLALTATIFVTVAFIVSEIGEGEEQLSYNTSKIESVLNMWKKNKWPFLSTALMLRCLVMILSGARSKHRALLCHHNLDNEALCLDVILSHITKYAVGLYLPMKLYDLINSGCKSNIEKSASSIAIWWRVYGLWNETKPMRNDKYIVCTLIFQTEYIFSVKSIQNLSRKKNTDDVSAVYFTQFILRLMRCLLLSTQELWKGAPYQVIFFHDHLSLSLSNYNY